MINPAILMILGNEIRKWCSSSPKCEIGGCGREAGYQLHCCGTKLCAAHFEAACERCEQTGRCAVTDCGRRVR